VFIERKIVDADYHQADGHSEQMIERVYRGEITQLSHEQALNPSTGETSFGISKSLFRGKTFVHKEFGKTWEIKKKNAAPGNVADYSFDVKSIRGPIEEMLSQNGWKLSLVTH